MTGVYIVIEWLVSATETACGFLCIQAFAERRFPKKQHGLFLGVAVGLMAIGVILLNLIEIRVNYITSFYAMCSLWMGACILYKGKAMTLLALAIGYLSLLIFLDAGVFSVAEFTGFPLERTHDFGTERLVLIFWSKSILMIVSLLVYLGRRRLRERFRSLSGSFVAFAVSVYMGSMGIHYLLGIKGLETNSFLFVLGCMLIFSFAALYFWTQVQKERREKVYTMQQNGILEKNYITAKESYESNARLYHDMDNHFALLQGYLDGENIKEAKEYLKKISDAKTAYQVQRYTGIEAADYILSQKQNKAEKNHIRMEIHGEYPRDCKIDPVDLCTILTNLLDNAVEACVKQPAGEPRDIHVAIRRVHQFIIIRIANSSISPPDIQDGKLRTSKKDKKRHGWGMKSVLSAVEKYQGTVEYDYKDKTFTVSAILFY